jgi:hypothetical protein
VCADTTHAIARGAGASPVIADFDGDAKAEIVQAAFDGNIYVWDANAHPLQGWPLLLHADGAKVFGRILSTPAVGDLTGDGIPDILSGSNEEVNDGSTAPAFLVDGRGSTAPGGGYVAGWPVLVASEHLVPLLGQGLAAAPAIAAFGRNGSAQALLQGNAAPPYVVPANPGAGSPVGFDPVFGHGSTATRPDTMLPLFSEPSVGDLDQDGVPDVIMTGGGASVLGILAGGPTPRPFQHLLGMWSGVTGAMMYGSPVPLEGYTIRTSQAVADVTGDGYPEVIVGTGGYFLRAVDACGCEALGWPKFAGGWLMATPAVGDIDGDHKLEVVTGTRDGYLFAWHTAGSDTGVIQWESYHHDNANSGDYRRRLGQGVLAKAARPLDCANDCVSSPSPIFPVYEPGGGGCSVARGAAGGPAGPDWAGSRSAPPGAIALFLLLAANALARRKRLLYTAPSADDTAPPAGQQTQRLPE